MPDTELLISEPLTQNGVAGGTEAELYQATNYDNVFYRVEGSDPCLSGNRFKGAESVGGWS